MKQQKKSHDDHVLKELQLRHNYILIALAIN